MKRFLTVVLTALIPVFALAQTKVACVGNSITYGAGIQNRDKNSYPAQLQAFLGEGYEVKNFGVSGTTMNARGDWPYWQTQQFSALLNYNPDVVVLKFGTNDSKPQNWRYRDRFVSDYQKMIDTLRSLPSRPRIILLTPVRCFLPDGSEINSRLIAENIRPIVQKLAFDNGIEVLNMFNLFGDVWEGHLMPDRLHPSSIGAGMMAAKVGGYLLATQKFEPVKRDYKFLKDSKEFNFYGYRGVDFSFNGVACKMVFPRHEAKGRPWVLRARFWGHEPQTDIELLERGFHIMYCDVADLYGAPVAIKRWNKFYSLMRRNGFSRKVVLEGMSRGGLPVYNWAAANPGKVACIYADAPVMDIKSWPMGKGSSAGSADDARQLLVAYGFKSSAEAEAWKKNPLDHAAAINRAGIPCLHVVGDADDVVPVAENTAIFERKMAEKGTPITVIHKPGVGHHPHSLNNPRPIVDFILKACGLFENDCVHAVPGNEFRSGAGWQQGNEWHSVANEIQSVIEGRHLKVLLLGNSITQGWGGSRKLVTWRPGFEAMNKVFGAGTWESAGISGDKTQNLLWRVRHGNYGSCKPDNVVIAIGVNNLLQGDAPEDVAEGIVAVADETVKTFPASRVILLGLFPAGNSAKSELRKKSDRVHELLARVGSAAFDYVNPTPWLVDADGSLSEGCYVGDGIHLSAKGYEVVAGKLCEFIE